MTDALAAELAACPFCGGVGKINCRPLGWIVQCDDRISGCPMNMRTHHCATEAAAIAAWNTRPSALSTRPSASGEEVEPNLATRKALHIGFEARTAALREDENDFIGAFNVGALAFLAALRAGDGR